MLSFFSLLVLAVMSGRAESFSAELLDTRGGETKVTRFNYQDRSYRYEVVVNGETGVVMVDGRSGVMRILPPGTKVYREAGPDDALARMADPFGCYAYYVRHKDVQTEGTELIAGFACRKQVVSGGGQVFVTGWIAEELDFPLRVLTNLDSRTLELRNIQRGPQDPALFAVPAGYQLLKDEPEPPPEWAGRIASAPVIAPPFERTLAEGAILRMHPQAGRKISLQATNPGRETCTFTGVGFKNGRPLQDPGMNTFSLEPGQRLDMEFQEEPGEADELVVRVARKSVAFKTKLVAAGGPDRVEAPSGTTAGTPSPTAALNAPATAEIAEQILVSWMGPANRDDYISIARPDQPPGASVNRTNIREGSPLRLWLPSEPGQFELRYVLGQGTKVLAKSPLEIMAVTASVDATGPINAAAWIEVKWVGPAREGDYISVATPKQPPGASVGRALVKAGNPLKVRAPGDPGNYEVRYVLARGTKVLAKAPVTVNAVGAEVGAPAVAKAGTEVEVTWRGPGYPEDFISIARVNQPAEAKAGSAPIQKGNPLKLRTPREPGTYEVRYVLGHGNRILAKAPLTIEAP